MPRRSRYSLHLHDCGGTLEGDRCRNKIECQKSQCSIQWMTCATCAKKNLEFNNREVEAEKQLLGLTGEFNFALLRAAAESAGLDDVELAKKADVVIDYIVGLAALETGQYQNYKPMPRDIKRLSDALGVPVAALYAVEKGKHAAAASMQQAGLNFGGGASV